MLTSLFAPAPPAAQPPSKGPTGHLASANDDAASVDFAQQLDEAAAQPPNAQETRQNDKLRSPGRSSSGKEAAKTERGPGAEPEPVPAQVEGKDRRTLPPESEDEGGGKTSAAESTTPQSVAALLAELRAAAPGASGAARRGVDAAAADGDTHATGLLEGPAAAHARRAGAGGEVGKGSAQESVLGSLHDSFAQQLSTAAAASVQDGSTLRADSFATAFNPLMATSTAPASAHTTGPARTEAQLSASPGSALFGTQLGAQISTFVQGGIEHARLHLNPADMGPVSVQIQLDGQNARVHLSAENPLTRQALEQALPQLASSLREAGLTLSGGGVFEQTRQGGGAQSGNDAGRDAGNGKPSSSADDGLPAVTRAAPRRRGVVDLVA